MENASQLAFVKRLHADEKNNEQHNSDLDGGDANEGSGKVNAADVERRLRELKAWEDWISVVRKRKNWRFG